MRITGKGSPPDNPPACAFSPLTLLSRRYFDTATREETLLTDEVRDFELKILDKFLWDWSDEELGAHRLTSIDTIVERSVDDEIGRLIAVDAKLFMISIFMIVVILAVTFSLPPKK